MGLAASRQEAFWESCGFGHIDRAKHFLEQGDIDVNWVSYVNDCCPIHTASQGKPEIVDLLIDNNCDVNAKDGRGNLAIHHAAMKGHVSIIQKLIDAGSEINAQDKNGWTALHNAAYWCRPEVVNILLNNKADVTLTNKDERTALHECARSQDFDDCRLGKIAKMLIDGGSEVNAKSSDLGEADLTALMYATYHNHPEVATALIDAKCDVNAIGATYWTALHWAADREHDELVYLLLEAGADPTKRDMKGDSALERANSENIKEVLSTAIALHKELQVVNKPIIQPIITLRKPVEPYKPKCNPNFKSQSLLPTNWTTKSDVKNLINEKKSRLAAQTSQTYRKELARRTGTNTINDGETSPDKIDQLNTEVVREPDDSTCKSENNVSKDTDALADKIETTCICDEVPKTDDRDTHTEHTSVKDDIIKETLCDESKKTEADSKNVDKDKTCENNTDCDNDKANTDNVRDNGENVK